MSLQKMISEKRLKDINIYSLAKQYKSGGEKMINCLQISRG